MRLFKLCRRVPWIEVTTLALLVAAGSGSGAAEPAPAERARQRPAKELDEQLAEELLEGLGAAPKEQPTAGRPRKGRPEETRQKEEQTPAGSGPSLDEKLLEGLEGEDVSLSSNPGGENPLVRLNQRMKQVERRIVETRGDEKTQRLQDEISDDLNKLIAALDRQCRQCKKQAQGSSRPQPGGRQTETTPAEQASSRPAEDSSNRLEEKETAKVDRAKMHEMLKDAWGHLPVHLRQQMEQSANEEFLPKYELEIAEYYRSLLSGRREKK